MIKILIMSDSHGEDEKIIEIMEHHKDADYIIHCGDSHFGTNHPLLSKMIVVKGNHDTAPFPLSQIIDLHDAFHNKIYVTHGHYENVYVSLDEIKKRARQKQATIVCHGHTHIPYVEQDHDLFIINPGSVLFNRQKSGMATYAILTIDQSNHKQVIFYDCENHMDVTDVALKEGLEMLSFFRQ